MRILIVEDKVRMAALLLRAVEREGYATLVAHDGETAIRAIERNHLDAIVMDVMMPKMDGFEVLTRMRSLNVTVPTILLTARDSSSDVVRGLDLGADDYLTKPFELSVLLARLRAVTRRPAGLLQEPMLRVGDVTLRPDSHDLLNGSTAIPLTRMEYTMLETLMKRAGRVVRKETLAQICWGTDAEFNEGSLYVLISALRAKLLSLDKPDALVTVRGVGYLLNDKATG